MNSEKGFNSVLLTAIEGMKMNGTLQLDDYPRSNRWDCLDRVLCLLVQGHGAGKEEDRAKERAVVEWGTVTDCRHLYCPVDLSVL
ncbi:hypothetical protein IGI52_000557 [Enterococcus sp. DIV0187]